MTSLGSLFQGSATFNEKFFLMLRWNILCFGLWLLLLVLLLDTTVRRLAIHHIKY